MTRESSPSARPTLTAAMIVRDEEHHVADCLASLEGVVDEVIVVDTGSTDATIDVARAHGATVHRLVWEDDFSHARNAALDCARGDWILYIDADERLRRTDRATVDALLASPACVAYRVLLYPHASATPCREYRLWRNDPRIRFTGVIHEKVVPAIRAVAETSGLEVCVCDLAIDHLGYDGDQTAKHLRNLPLLTAQLESEPGNVFNWRHLARVHFALGRTADGEAALEHALTAIRQAPVPAPVGALVYAELVDRHRGTPRARSLITEAVTTYPQEPVLVWTRAGLALDDDDPALALHWLDRLLEPDAFTLDDSMSYDRRLFDAWPHAARGLSLFRSGRFHDAAAAYRAAEAAEPDVLEHRVKRQMCEHLARPVRGEWSRAVDIADVAVQLVANEGLHARAVEAVIAALPDAATDAALLVDFDAATHGDEPEWDHADGDVLARWQDDTLLLGHGSVRARVDEGAAFIAGDHDLQRAFRQLFPYIITHLLATRGRFVLHGGVIVRDGRAVLVLGPTGSGKSTLVVGATAAGWAVASDDLVAVRMGEEGVEVRGIAKPFLVPPELVTQLRLEGQRVENDSRGRWRVHGLDADDRWYPLATSVVSARSDGSEVGVRSLPSHELLQWLLFSFLAARDERRLPLYLPVAAAITQQGGAVVEHGPHLATQPAAIEALVALR